MSKRDKAIDDTLLRLNSRIIKLESLVCQLAYAVAYAQGSNPAECIKVARELDPMRGNND